MDAGQISHLLRPYLKAEPSADLLNIISAYIDILIKWNKSINLTSVRDPEEIVRRHFGESLFAARILLQGGTRVSTSVTDQKSADETAGDACSKSSMTRAIDVGSGAGFPGMVLKIHSPELRLTLIESHGKKATFLREVVRILGLSDVVVAQERAERFQGMAELVTLRAVEKFPDMLPVAASMVLPGGMLGILIGEGQMGEAEKILAGRWETVRVPESRSRVLAVWSR